MAVLLEYQRMGIGSELVEQGLCMRGQLLSKTLLRNIYS
jgi:predicted N-acetyltransferase YhbS